MTPTIAALTILSKFQSDIKNSESQVIDYLHSQIGQVKLVFDKFDAIVSPSATYLMPGDELSIKAGIGAFSSAAKPNITINGAPQTVGADGTAEWKTKVSGSGTVSVKIEYAKPDGSKDVVTKDIKYTVGQPSGASVFLEKMNVLYIKEDNPVTVSGGSVGREKVKVSSPTVKSHTPTAIATMSFQQPPAKAKSSSTPTEKSPNLKCVSSSSRTPQVS
jgi:gliding motility-associated protein GldM